MKTFSADYCLSFHLLSEKLIFAIGADKNLNRVVWKIFLAIIFLKLCKDYKIDRG